MSPIIVPAAPASGTLVYEWVDPAGVVRPLSGPASNVVVRPGERGLGYPPVVLADDKLPFTSGRVTRHVGIEARLIELPLYIWAASASAMEALLDSIHGWFATADERTQTPGYFRVTRQDGTQRQVRCFYVGGLEGDLSWNVSGPDWQEVTVILKAADPWAADIAEESAIWDQGDLPNVAVLNDGTIDAYTRWEFTGPITTFIQLYNSTIGRTILITWSVPSGKILYLDTRPAPHRTTLSAYDSDGVNRYDKIHPGSYLWSLAPGSNTIEITTGGTTAATQVALYWLQRYRGLRR